MRIQDILESKSVNNTIKLILLKRHFHDISKNILIFNRRTDFGRSNANHVWTEIKKRNFSARLVKF